MATWVREWLHYRKQKVVLNGEHSKLQEVLSGVPQGSVLEQTLFLIFVNCLTNCALMTSRVSLFL